jgi:23S rRNA pseudouridine2457 synthase
MVSQFKSSHQVRLLGELTFTFPEGTHAIGRLDRESEGLLLLTTNKKITQLLFQSAKKHSRTYLVMVKNQMTPETINAIRNGIPIKTTSGQLYISIPEKVEVIENPLMLYPFAQDHRCVYPHTWLSITLTEGKYHQVRKMVFATGHRCLRLIRLSIDELRLNSLSPGEVKEIEEEELFRLIPMLSQTEVHKRITFVLNLTE